jgi:hypothetical protein
VIPIVRGIVGNHPKLPPDGENLSSPIQSALVRVIIQRIQHEYWLLKGVTPFYFVGTCENTRCFQGGYYIGEGEFFGSYYYVIF